MNINELRMLALDRAIQMVGHRPGPETVRLAAIFKTAVSIEGYLTNGRIEGFIDSLPSLFDKSNLVAAVPSDTNKTITDEGLALGAGDRNRHGPDKPLAGKRFVSHKESPSVCVTSDRMDDTGAGVTASAPDVSSRSQSWAAQVNGPITLTPLFVRLLQDGHAASNGEARRLVRRGCITVNGQLAANEVMLVSFADKLALVTK